MSKNRVITYTAIKDVDKNNSKRHKYNETHSTILQNKDITNNLFETSSFSSQNDLDQYQIENIKAGTRLNQLNDLSINEIKSHISGDLNDCIDDIENILQKSLPNENNLEVKMLPPILRYSKKWTLSITELSSQLWCERNTELTLITGIRPESKAIKEGLDRHFVLEQLDHETVEVIITSDEEALGIKMLNSIILLTNLLQTGKCREVWVVGTYNDYVFRGIIDQLEIVAIGDKKYVKISDTKTRSIKNTPSAAQKHLSAIQVQAYNYLINNLKSMNVDFDKLYKYSELNPDKPFVIPELKKYKCLKGLEKHFLKSFENLPEVHNIMEISYECEGEIFSVDKIKLDFVNLVKTIEYCLEFWDGDRSSEIVQPYEAWKCKSCHLLDKCDDSPYKKLNMSQE